MIKEFVWSLELLIAVVHSLGIISSNALNCFLDIAVWCRCCISSLVDIRKQWLLDISTRTNPLGNDFYLGGISAYLLRDFKTSTQNAFKLISDQGIVRLVLILKILQMEEYGLDFINILSSNPKLLCRIA